jgi:hypothetical protein
MRTRWNHPTARNIVGTLLLSISLVSSVSAQDIPTLTVCDIFKDLASWSGKVIALKGNLLAGFEIFSLNSEGRCTEAPLTEGIRWPTSIWLSGSPLGERDAPRDLPSVQFLGDLLGLLQDSYMRGNERGIPPYQITATIIGVLRTRSSYGLVREENGRKFLYGGFGHLAAYPAELEFIAVKDIQITGLSLRYSRFPEVPETK